MKKFVAAILAGMIGLLMAAEALAQGTAPEALDATAFVDAFNKAWPREEKFDFEVYPEDQRVVLGRLTMYAIGLFDETFAVNIGIVDNNSDLWILFVSAFYTDDYGGDRERYIGVLCDTLIRAALTLFADMAELDEAVVHNAVREAVNVFTQVEMRDEYNYVNKYVGPFLLSADWDPVSSFFNIVIVGPLKESV